MSKSLIATAQAPANIAFIKYWGKKDSGLRLPANDSISMNLGGINTTTTVEFDAQLLADEVIINGQPADERAYGRVVKFLDKIRQLASQDLKAKVTSQNSFPTGAGLASSASGFAALALAAVSALQLELSERELSQLARQGSGSACRSIPDGFAYWKTADNSVDSFAYSLHSADHWAISDVIALVDQSEKSTSSTDGHKSALTSPFFKTRIEEYLPTQLEKVKTALAQRNFKDFGQAIEEEALNLHAICLTSKPPAIYWNSATLSIIHSIRIWREEGLEAYFTIDAGPNVHVLVETKNAERLKTKLTELPEVEEVLIAQSAVGARVLS